MAGCCRGSQAERDRVAEPLQVRTWCQQRVRIKIKLCSESLDGVEREVAFTSFDSGEVTGCDVQLLGQPLLGQATALTLGSHVRAERCSQFLREVILHLINGVFKNLLVPGTDEYLETKGSGTIFLSGVRISLGWFIRSSDVRICSTGQRSPSALVGAPA